MFKRTWILIIGLIFITIILAIFTIKGNAQAFNSHACGEGDAGDQNPHCQPTSTPTPTKTPKCGWNEDHPCITPTVTPTPTPTKLCYEGEEIPVPCPSPTPSSSPSEIPTPSVASPSGTQGGPSYNGAATSIAQTAVCNSPFQAPVLQGFKADGNGSVTFSWWPSPNASKYSITYGYQPDKLIYGEDNIPSSSTSITLNGLLVGHNVWAIVQAWQGGCAESSNELDPKVK